MIPGDMQPPPVSTIEGLIEGRIVHYVMDGVRHRPAIVTKVVDPHRGYVGLAVMLAPDDPERAQPDQFDRQAILPCFATFSPTGVDRGTWHWIERA